MYLITSKIYGSYHLIQYVKDSLPEEGYLYQGQEAIECSDEEAEKVENSMIFDDSNRKFYKTIITANNKYNDALQSYLGKNNILIKEFMEGVLLGEVSQTDTTYKDKISNNLSSLKESLTNFVMEE